MTDRIYEVCEQVTKLKIYGNIVGNLWYSKIKTEYKKSINGKTQIVQSNKPNLLAISILADIIYWHKLTEERDEAGNTIAWKKKFKGDKLQKSYQSYADFFGTPKSTVKQAFDQLERMELITREFRNIKVGKDKLPINNVMFIEVIPKNIESLSHDIQGVSPRQSQGCYKDSLRDATKTVSGTNTDTTTNNTPEKYSKEYYSNSKEVAIEDENFDSQNSINKPLDSSAEPHNQEKTKAQSLRDGAKSIKQNNKKEIKKLKSVKCPLRYQPYLDIWEKYTNRKFRGINDAYTRSWTAIRDIVNGEYFSHDKRTTINKKYHNYKLTIEDWKLAVQRFAIMRNNMDYYPAKKDKISKLDPEKFLYNPYNPNNINKSYFITCLENKPKPLAPVCKDKTPVYTEVLLEECKRRFDWESNELEAAAIKCGPKLKTFFEENKDDIHQFDYHYKYPPQQVEILLDILEENDSPNHPAKPMFLWGNLTFEKLLPQKLKEVGSMF